MLLKQGAKSQRITVIHNGIDCDEFKGESVDRVSLLTKWGLRNDEIIIGMIARLDPMNPSPPEIKTFFPFIRIEEVI